MSSLACRLIAVLLRNIEVEAEEEDDSDDERDEGEEDQLLSQSLLLELDSKFVLLFRQGVAFAFEESLADTFQVQIHVPLL
eukprot:CAMPEP_0185579744 /NCGR_PEP_ID=MMETSP0434-20130131/15393_1 /TAXON_ID=626734 ORGANISM="Favella taraikaensis, Strain Fe Narragansett Bay" /NCGR_SAMPLE_ID=MMETSP0434 /ASSEMBLY_ACC=CAM_ASM_000379 /LENGTH=80 /DNA_ID=CAMNT_0028197837 /DNA_START=51 /DNA_END=290 /DNA_ORIENTATION=-